MADPLRDLRRIIQNELATTGMAAEIVSGRKHFKVTIGGHLVSIFPHNGRDQGPRAERNLIAQVRRFVRHHQNDRRFRSCSEVGT